MADETPDDDRRLNLYCVRCKSVVQVTVLAVHSFEDEPDEDEVEVVFGHCSQCDLPMLASEQYDVIDDQTRTVRLFPPDARRVGFALPKRVERSYEEAVKCELAQAPFATVTMVRRTLEAVAKEFDPSARTAFDGLKSMKNKGAISDELHEWANSLRQLGNLGAHATEENVSVQDARDALDFLQALLDTIYHFRPRFQEMEKRAAKRKAKREGAKTKAGTSKTKGKADDAT